jgi:hypothetical protein
MNADLNMVLNMFAREEEAKPSVEDGEPVRDKPVLTYQEYMAKYYAERNTPGDSR